MTAAQLFLIFRMTEFKALTVRHYTKGAEHLGPESLYWKKYSKQVLAQQIGPVTCVDFSPEEPHQYAVTSSTRVEIFDPNTQGVAKTVSRFKDVAYSGTFRNDGKLLVAGGEDPLVQIFEIGSRAVLRSFSGHTAAVHTTRFSTSKLEVISGSDDRTVRGWDIEAGVGTSVLEGHKDYVRAVLGNPQSPAVWMSGGYDHQVLCWDTRAPTPLVRSFSHDSPVEALLLLPGGTTLLSAGGTQVCVWDLVAGKLVQSLSHHQKTITSLCLDSAGTRVLSGGVDQQVKIYDVHEWKVLHMLRFNAPILSVAMSPDSTRIAVGMNDGVLAVRSRGARNLAAVAEHRERTRSVRAGTYRYFVRGKDMPAGADDYKVAERKARKLRAYDIFLKKYEFGNALDAAVRSGDVAVVAAMLEQLNRRRATAQALDGRTEAQLVPLLRFLVGNINHPRYAPQLLQFAQDIFERHTTLIGQSISVDQLFVTLNNKLKDEIAAQKQLMQVQGLIDCMISVSTQSQPVVSS